ncbi:MAG TPA: hypothetical protein VGX96_11440 [Candidatus Elarobacter sp.]|jgi:hypothetical protein|nr:hypothetical protein [Candidatus Elarobacter sp.]
MAERLVSVRAFQVFPAILALILCAGPARTIAADEHKAPDEGYATFKFGAALPAYPYLESGETALRITWASAGCTIRVSTTDSPDVALDTAGGVGVDLRGYVVNRARRIRSENCTISYQLVPQTFHNKSGRSNITAGDIGGV